MSATSSDLAGGVGWVHPHVLAERARERLLLAVSIVVPLVLALAVSVAMPKPSLVNVAVLAALTVGVLAVVMLMCSTRYAVSVGLLVLYLGLLDGPIKLKSASEGASGIRNILIIAISIGMIARLVVGRQRVRLPPLSGWVLAFVAVVLIEALNPHTNGVLKVLGGYRQQLGYVPFFFFGYLLMRSPEHFRKLFLVFGVIALANGVVGTVQSRETPAQLGSWGPGYSKRLSGSEGLGDGYNVEGVEHVRPMALGSASGFGGAVGTLALPGLLALLSVGRLRRRWPVLLCCTGALLGVATAASRSSVLVCVAALGSYAALSLIAGLRVSRPLLGLIVVGVLAFTAGSVLVALDGNAIFHRQERVTSFIASLAGGEGEEEGGGEQAGDGKTKHLSQIPNDLVHAPFGFGLGRGGAVSGFGGSELVRFEEKKVSGGSTYNLLALETGAPGLLLWIGLSINVLFLGVTRLRRILDPELRTYLVAILASFIAFTLLGLGGSVDVNATNAYLWGAAGVVAYWLAGPGWLAARKRYSTSAARLAGSRSAARPAVS